MNNCNFIGRLTADPEIKALSSGKSLANFTIAVDREYKDGSGNKITDFIPCIAFDPTASLLAKYFNKGNLIGVSGRFESRSYADSNGNKKIFYSIMVNHIDFIQGKSESKPQAPAPVAPQKKIDPTGDPNIDYPYYTDDQEQELDLPFPLEDS